MCSSLYKQRLSRKWIHTYTYVYVVNGILKQVDERTLIVIPAFCPQNDGRFEEKADGCCGQ